MDQSIASLLSVRKDGSPGRTYYLHSSDKDLLIGTSPKANIQISEATYENIDTYHCNLSLEDNAYILRITTEIFPTFINGDEVACATPLKHGDVISVGDKKFKFFYSRDKKFDIPLDELKYLMDTLEPEIHMIMSGKTATDRYTLYINGGDDRHSLDTNNGLNYFSDGMVEYVTGKLITWFSSPKFFDGVMKVLLPDTLVLVLSKIQNISFKKALTLTLDGESFASAL